MEYILLIGLAGMTCILLGFVLNIFKKLNSHDLRFLWLNLVGSVLLVIYALSPISVPFLILNSVWSAVALWGIIHAHRQKV